MSIATTYCETVQNPNGSRLSATERAVPLFNAYPEHRAFQWRIEPIFQGETKVFPEPSLLNRREMVIKGISTERATLSWLDEAIEKLNSLLCLDENWDSYGAHRVSLEAVFAAIYVLASVLQENTPLPTFVPTPSGDVQLEWHQSGIDLEVEVNSSGNIEIFFEDELEKNEAYEYESFQGSVYDLKLLPEYVRKITERG